MGLVFGRSAFAGSEQRRHKYKHLDKTRNTIAVMGLSRVYLLKHDGDKIGADVEKAENESCILCSLYLLTKRGCVPDLTRPLYWLLVSTNRDYGSSLLP